MTCFRQGGVHHPLPTSVPLGPIHPVVIVPSVKQLPYGLVTTRVVVGYVVVVHVVPDPYLRPPVDRRALGRGGGKTSWVGSLLESGTPRHVWYPHVSSDGWVMDGRELTRRLNTRRPRSTKVGEGVMKTMTRDTRNGLVPTPDTFSLGPVRSTTTRLVVSPVLRPGPRWGSGEGPGRCGPSSVSTPLYHRFCKSPSSKAPFTSSERPYS